MKKQRKWKPYSGKILSMLLSLCLLFGMLPAAALAVEGGPPEGEAVVECTQAEGCTATEHKEGCPLYEAPPIDEEPVDNETPAEPSPAEPMAAEQVAALITALPEYADATPDDVADIEAAQVAYDALTVEEQAAVDAELVSKLAALTELAENLNAYDPSNDASVYEATPAMSGTCGDPNVNEGKNVTWALTQNEGSDPATYTLTISGNGAMADYETRKTPWYNWRETITQITLPNGLTHIGKSAFLQTKITKITIPDTVTSIGPNAFWNCNTIETKIPASVTELGGTAFFGTFKVSVAESNMTYCANENVIYNKEKTELIQASQSLSGQISIPNTVVSIDPYAFSGCTNISGTLTIPDTVETIGNAAFNGCTNLAELKLGSGVVSIGESAFAGNRNMKGSVVIPGSVTQIQQSTFQNTGITNLECGSGVRAIGESAFQNTDLQSVKLNDGLVSIGKKAFFDCGNLTGNLTIPQSVTEIGAQAFVQCGGLNGTLTIGGSLTKIGQSIFGNAKDTSTKQTKNFSHLVIREGVTEIEASTFGGWTDLSAVSLPKSLITIGDSAFSDCTKVTCIVIPQNVTVIGAGAFSGSRNVVAVVNSDSITLGNQYSLGIYTNTNSIAYFKGTMELTSGTLYSPVAHTNGGVMPTDITEPVDKTLVTPTKEDSIFAGWYSTKDFTGEPVTQYKNDGNYQEAYYAKWIYDITFNGNGSDGGSMTKQTVTEGDTTTALSANSYTKTGYTFSGWNTAADGTGTSYANQATTKPSGNTTLYAQWTPNTYTISFNGGEGAEGTTASVTATYDAPATLTANGFTKSGYNFAGWTATSGGTVVEYSDGAQVLNLTATASGTITLYAVWTTKTVLTPDVAVQTKTYNGAAQAFLLDGTYTITYQRNSQAATPKDAGTYDVVISTAETDTTAAYKNTVYGGLVITPATLTITADNQSIHVGDTLPSYTYKVSGWRGSDGTLTTPPTFTCATADVNTTGTYPIKASGADAGSNYTITYVDGILTVSSRSSGGGGGSSGSSSGVSGSGGNASVSAGGGSVSNSQMTAAVDKAEKGATIGIKATDSIAVSLPVSGMKDAAANDNHVTVATRSGEVTLSAAAIKGLVEGTSAKQAIQVRVTTATATAAGVDAGTPVFDVSVSVGSTAVHSFDGSLSITLTVSNLSKIENPYVLHILADGTKQYLKPTVKGNQLTVSGIRNLSYFAVIPGSEVPAEPEPLPFTDVAEDFWAYDAISYVYENGLFVGTSESTFSPEVTMTREMLWTVLGRMSGAELTGSGVFEQARQWVMTNGVSDGTNGGDTITREQMVTMLYRYAGSPSVNGNLSGYADASTVSGYAADAMAWAVGSGIISGTSATTLSPQGSATRAQVATILMRFVENTEK